ncbi:DUF421 domain-containing protein [Ferruginibacter sp. HRS2-29]|uniref:DUF421 domain-containing protein n=1 Tax=Ferruginibacter sp. HRS2-29 TaxID=2487334 RepID=UPI0020CD70A0|nr:DUF421 domain-containing protein [Ferruginibacter sp. HRS2-29]MCP9752984.1 DUF421 domain-containing protein [Ferruginibacter sp. HRS2-29]
MDEHFKVFDFHRILFGDAPAMFMLEIVFRTIIMYVYTIALLRVLGKRGIGQLSTLELAIIICFGSAVGDPMMGAEVPILHGLTAITAVALLQIGMERVINRNKKVEAIMEGTPECVVDNGRIILQHLDKDNISHEDLFRALRSKDVEHLGQVRKAFFETSGQVSVFFQSPRNIKPGLSVMPAESGCENHGQCLGASGTGFYSCANCGDTRQFKAGASFTDCTVCNCHEWKASTQTNDLQKD